jgi:sigma-B regulation protein RsbU (phosphoserine phosphatase)
MLVREDGTLEALAATGIPLGIVDDAEYQEVEVECGPRDLLFAATDGLAEARRDDAFFGDDRLPDLLAAQAPSLAPQELVELLAGELEAWAPEIDDDVLILAARPRGGD